MKLKFMMSVATAAAIAGCCCTKQGPETCCRYPGSINEGFVSLFNGVDLEGWEGATAMYGVDPKEPGVLQCFPERKVAGSSGNLYTAKEYENFVRRSTQGVPVNEALQKTMKELQQTYHLDQYHFDF